MSYRADTEAADLTIDRRHTAMEFPAGTAGRVRLLTLDEGDAVFTWTEGTTNGPRVQVGRLTLDP